MIALDTNLLVYAHRVDNPFHVAAAPLVGQLAAGRAAWAIPWPCLHEFYSIATNPRIHPVPTPIDVAIRQIEIWLESPTLLVLAENEQHWPQLRDLIGKGKVSGAMVHDARIAAICLSHGVRELWSADRDFSRFPGLRTRNPLV